MLIRIIRPSIVSGKVVGVDQVVHADIREARTLVARNRAVFEPEPKQEAPKPARPRRSPGGGRDEAA